MKERIVVYIGHDKDNDPFCPKCDATRLIEVIGREDNAPYDLCTYCGYLKNK